MKNLKISALALGLVFTVGCGDVHDHDHDHDHDHNHGLATTLILTFSPSDGGDALSFSWADPENDGDPVIDDIILPDGSDDNSHVERTYDVSVQVLNELEEPVEDVTLEIEELAEEHQFFFTGSAVDGPATRDNTSAILAHEYGDSDANGLPLGIINTFTTLNTGSGEMVVTLRHLPPEGGNDTKVEGLADDVANDGFAAIGGDNDIQVTFNVTVE